MSTSPVTDCSCWVVSPQSLPADVRDRPAVLATLVSLQERTGDLDGAAETLDTALASLRAVASQGKGGKTAGKAGTARDKAKAVKWVVKRLAGEQNVASWGVKFFSH